MIKWLSLAFLAPIAALAGTMNGGGETSVICRDHDGKIKTAEVLDVFEGKAFYGLKPALSGSTFEEKYKSVKDKVMASQPGEIDYLESFDLIPRISHVMPEGTVLTPVDDAAVIAIPKGCKLEQTANFIDDTLLLIDGEIWNHLNEENRVALYVHEAIYRLERFHGATNSRRARKITAHLVSNFQFESVRAKVPANAIFCSAAPHHANPNSNSVMGLSRFFVYPGARPDLSQFQFLDIMGHAIYSRKFAVIPAGLPLIATQSGPNEAGGDFYSKFEKEGSLQIRWTQTQLFLNFDGTWYDVDSDCAKALIK